MRSFAITALCRLCFVLEFVARCYLCALLDHHASRSLQDTHDRTRSRDDAFVACADCGFGRAHAFEHRETPGLRRDRSAMTRMNRTHTGWEGRDLDVGLD